MFVAFGVSSYLYLRGEAYRDEAYAAKVMANIRAAALADEVKRSEYYSKEMDKLKVKESEYIQNIDEVTADSRVKQRKLTAAQAEIVQMKSCEDARIALNFELTTCISNISTITVDFNTQIENLTLNHNEIVSLLNREKAEILAEKSVYVEKYARTAGELVKNKAKSRRERIIFVAIGIVAGVLISK